jgi:hypothetical protein
VSKPAFPGPYTDPNITVRDPAHVSITPTPGDGVPLAPTTVYDPAGRQTDDFSHTAAPPHSRPTWVHGKDPYANGGAVDQTFLNNQG